VFFYNLLGVAFELKTEYSLTDIPPNFCPILSRFVPQLIAGALLFYRLFGKN